MPNKIQREATGDAVGEEEPEQHGDHVVQRPPKLAEEPRSPWHFSPEAGSEREVFRTVFKQVDGRNRHEGEYPVVVLFDEEQRKRDTEPTGRSHAAILAPDYERVQHYER